MKINQIYQNNWKNKIVIKMNIITKAILLTVTNMVLVAYMNHLDLISMDTGNTIDLVNYIIY